MNSRKLILLTSLLFLICCVPSIAEISQTESAFQYGTSPNIVFTDARVKAHCIQNWDTNGDGELSHAEAASVTSLNYVFMKDSLITSFNELQYFTGLNSIHQYAFRECKALKSIELPNSLTIIDYGAFMDCSELTNVIIPNSVISIGTYAFSGCSKLSRVTLSEAVTEISYGAFYQCSGLCSITIPSSIKLIDEFAFDGCSSLTSLSIPESVDSIGRCAFYGCDALNEVSCHVFDPATISMGSFVFDRYPTYYTNRYLYVPLGTISAYLSSSDWSPYFGHIIEIGGSSSPNITFADSKVKALCVQNWDRNGDGELNEAEAAAVTSLNNVFKGNSYITSFNEFRYFTNVTSIDESEFSECYMMKNISIPNSVTQIGRKAFYNCYSLQNVSIPENVISINEKTFFNCSSLTNVLIPNSVTYIGNQAFAFCSKLPSIIIPNSVSEIDIYAFQRCNDLSRITLGYSVTKIGFYAFYECDNVTEVISKSLTPPVINDWSCFTSPVYSNARLLVPYNSLDEYKNATYWKNFINIYGIDNENNILAEGLTLDITNKELEIDDSFILTASISPNIVANNTVSWSSSNSNIAVVNKDGKVTAISAGSVIIKATTTDGTNISADCNVTVKKRLVSSISLNKSSTTIYVGNTEQLSANISPSDASDTILTWTSSNSNIASVNNNGVITAISAGTAIVTAATTDGSNLSASCTVFVQNVLATSICLNKTSLTLDKDETAQLVATVYPSNATIKTVTWKSANTSIARVSSNGVVTAVAAGTVTITASTIDGSNLYATCNVTVKQLATSISLNKTDATIYTGNTLQLNATVLPSTTSNPSVTWSSSNTSVATVSSTGLVTAKSAGNAVITAKTSDGSNLSASCNVTVKQLATSISLNMTDATIYTGNTLQLNATVLPSTTSNPSVTWSSSNTSAATVSSTGLVTAKSTGTAVITAITADGTNLSASCSVTVKRLATSISLNKTSATLYLDQTVQLTATVSPSNATDKSVVWSSSDDGIASVTNTGLVTAIATGNATIKATTTDGSNLSATCAITVKAYVTSLTLDQSEATILEGDTITLTPTILPSYATNQNLNWSSSNTSVASVNNGAVVGRSGGEATVTARTADGSNLSATCKVTVVPNFDISAPDLSHIRGSLNNKFDLTIDLSNRYDITGMQFDLQLPTDVTIAKDSEGEFNIWLDDTRKSRNHTATASIIGGNAYRILVSSATANILKGHSGTVLHIMIEIPISHVSGNKQIRYTNIILSEPDETRHTVPSKTSMISYYYLEGDANADVSVDVADYVITGNYILQNSPENFWYDAANVDHNSTVDVNDLTGITNIALGRREGGVRQMPAIQASEDDIVLSANPVVIQAGQTKSMNLCLDGNYAFAGFQMDLQLPQGIKLVDASLTDIDSGLSIATAELPDESIRLLASSFSLKDLAVNNSSFLRITLSAEDEIGADGRIILNGIKFSKRNMSLHTVDHYEIPVGNGVSGLEQVYSRIRIYPEGKSIIIDSPESGTARIVTIAGISLSHDIQPGHNVIPMDDAGLYIVTLNGTTAKLYLK